MKPLVTFRTKPDHIQRLRIVSMVSVYVFGRLTKQARLPNKLSVSQGVTNRCMSLIHFRMFFTVFPHIARALSVASRPVISLDGGVGSASKFDSRLVTLFASGHQSTRGFGLTIITVSPFRLSAFKTGDHESPSDERYGVV